MKAIEFYTTPEGEVTMRPIGEAERQLKETDTDFIQAFLTIGKSSVFGIYRIEETEKEMIRC